MTTDTRQQVRKVTFSYLKMILFGLGITLSAILTARLINKCYPWSQIWINYLEYSGYICWSATLGMLGLEIQTWGGSSAAEKLDKNLIKIFSLLGILAFVMAKELVADGN